MYRCKLLFRCTRLTLREAEAVSKTSAGKVIVLYVLLCDYGPVRLNSIVYRIA